MFFAYQLSHLEKKSLPSSAAEPGVFVLALGCPKAAAWAETHQGRLVDGFLRNPKDSVGKILRRAGHELRRVEN